MESANKDDQPQADVEEFGTTLLLALMVLFGIFVWIDEFSSIKTFFTRPQPDYVQSGSRMVNGELVSPDNSAGETPTYGVVKQQLKTALQRNWKPQLFINDLELSDPVADMLLSDTRHIQCWRYQFTLRERTDRGEMRFLKGYAWAKDNHLLTISITPPDPNLPRPLQ